MLRTAAQRRFSRKYHRVVPDMIVDLVRDEKIVPEEQICDAYKAVLKQVDNSMKNAA